MNLQQTRARLRQLAKRAGLGDDYLPTFGLSDDNARPHIEERGGVYYYVVRERGKELERRLFLDENELFYHILKEATSTLAADREVAARRDDSRDSRREKFRIQEELLRQINAEWAARVSREHAELLKKHPIDDAATLRATRCAELRAAGLQADEAWQRACEEYPLPS